MNIERAAGGGEGRQPFPKPRQELAWQPDLIAAFAVESTAGRLDNFQPVKPDQGGDFIEDSVITAQIISGGRGTGKSTAVYYRTRYLHRQESLHFVREVPPHGFYLPPLSVAIPAAALPNFSTIDAWCAAWRVVLGLIFAFTIKRHITPRTASLKDKDWLTTFGVTEDDSLLRKLVQRVYQWSQNPHSDCVEDLLSTILQANPPARTLDTLYREKIEPVQASLAFKGSWVLVVDRIDEALADHRRAGALLAADLRASYVDNEKVTQENVASLLHHVWRCAQAAYAIVAHQLRAAWNGKLVVLGTIRAETYLTFLANSGQPRTKIDFFVLRLEPDEAVLRAIFRLNVDLMRDRCLVPPSFPSDDVDLKADWGLVGCKSLYSRAVFGFMETPYEYLRRHAFHTPRSLVTLGREVSRVRPVKRPGIEDATWRPPELVIDAVSRCSVEVFNEYVGTLFPSWDSDYEKGFELIAHDVIIRDEIDRPYGIEDRFRRLCPGKPMPLIAYLHSCGLVGVPAPSPSGKWRQSFVFRGHEEPILPTDFAYVLLHPAFAAYLKHKFPGSAAADFENRRLVPCPGGPCPERLSNVALRLLFTQTPNSAVVSCFEYRPNEESLFESADRVSEALVVVLSVALCIHGAGYLTPDQLEDVAVSLAALGFIPRRLGHADRNADNVDGDRTSARLSKVAQPASQAAKKSLRIKKQQPGKSPAEWIRDICARAPGEGEKTVVTNAKKLLDSGSGLTIGLRNDDGIDDRLCLYWTAAPAARPMERDEIEIVGLDISLFLGARLGVVPL
jgi:hypothetical protein